MPDTLLVAVPLTDEWGGAYLQIVVTVVVFAVGLPAILIQTVTGPEIHRIAAERNHDGSRLLIVVMTSSVLLLVGMVVAYQAQHEWQWAPDDRVVGLAVTGLVGLTVGLSWWRIRLPARERLTRHIVREGVRAFRKTCSIPDSIAEDLVELGTSVSRRHDREIVLSGIRTLMRRVHVCGRYEGNGLEQLILAVPRVAADPSLSLVDENVLLGAQILLEASAPLDSTLTAPNSLKARVRAAARRIRKSTARVGTGNVGPGQSSTKEPVTDITGNGEGAEGTAGAPPPTADMVSAVRAFVRLLEAVALRAAEPTVNALLQEFSALDRFPPTLAADGLARVGRIAAEHGRYRIGVICLNRIEDLLARSSPRNQVPVEARLLGLAVHIGARSPSAWEHLCNRPMIAELLSPARSKRFAEYAELYVDDADYATADFMAQLASYRGAMRPTLAKQAKMEQTAQEGENPRVARHGSTAGLGAALAWALTMGLGVWALRERVSDQAL